MGHRQKMTRRQRIEWDGMQYRAQIEAKRGNNFPYLTDELGHKLRRLGYVKFELSDPHYLGTAKSAVNDLREAGNYARIVCIANRLRIKTYAVYYRPRMVDFEESDGTEWLYRGCLIQEQIHPTLLRYCCYHNLDERIEAAATKTEAKEIIDNWLGSF